MSKGCPEAKRFVESVGQSARLERLFVTEQVDRRAYKMLDCYADHPFSIVDATSFVLMRRHRLRYAFAFDRPFRIAGFSRVAVDVRLPD